MVLYWEYLPDYVRYMRDKGFKGDNAVIKKAWAILINSTIFFSLKNPAMATPVPGPRLPQPRHLPRATHKPADAYAGKSNHTSISPRDGYRRNRAMIMQWPCWSRACY